MRIEREKQNFYFYREDGRRYRLCLDDGIMYSLADQPMQSVPKILTKGVMYDIRNNANIATDIRLAVYLYENHRNDKMKLAQELLAVFLNYYPNFKRYREIMDLLENCMELPTAKSMASFCKWAKERYEFVDSPNSWVVFRYGNRNYQLYALYNEWYKEHEIQKMYAELGIMPKDEFTEDMATCLYNSLRNNTMFNSLSAIEKKRKYAQWFKSALLKGIWNYKVYVRNANRSFFSDFISDIITYHEDMGIELEKTNNIFRYYTDTAKSYKIWSEHHEEEKFASKYTGWENVVNLKVDGLCIVLPKSPKALVAEGTAQHNCVGGYADYVLNGQRIVLFIRRENNVGESYITCDFFCDKYDKYKWKCNQYLAANNNTPTSAEAKRMREALIEWVNDNINNK